jgi:hypothetical protein
MDVCTAQGYIKRNTVARSNLHHIPAMYTALRKTTWGGLFPIFKGNYIVCVVTVIAWNLTVPGLCRLLTAGPTAQLAVTKQQKGEYFRGDPAVIVDTSGRLGARGAAQSREGAQAGGSRQQPKRAPQFDPDSDGEELFGHLMGRTDRKRGAAAGAKVRSREPVAHNAAIGASGRARAGPGVRDNREKAGAQRNRPELVVPRAEGARARAQAKTAGHRRSHGVEQEDSDGDDDAVMHRRPAPRPSAEAAGRRGRQSALSASLQRVRQRRAPLNRHDE